jgi:hypothetical protein
MMIAPRATSYIILHSRSGGGGGSDDDAIVIVKTNVSVVFFSKI